MKAAGGFCRRHDASFSKKDNLKGYYCPYSFLHILVDVYVSRRLFFFLNWDSPSDCLCKKSYEFWPKFCYFKSGPTFPQQSMGVFKHSLERKSSFLRKEGRFYLVSSLSKHFIQVCFWGFPSLWFFFPTSQNSCERFYHFTNKKSPWKLPYMYLMEEYNT